mmetsp:Transcript_20512/g.32516  ORF Transcript_20512/g.32516 Transcript_20512/m.32516 type:complete len:238 (-) Transcript_20512:197-910(-)
MCMRWALRLWRSERMGRRFRRRGRRGIGTVAKLEEGKLGDIDESRMRSGYYHEILGVSPLATQDVIRSAYHSMLFQSHPDHGGNAEKFLAVREAFAALTMANKGSLFELTRGISDAAWGGYWSRLREIWGVVRIKMPGTEARFGSLFFDDVLYACARREDYDTVVEIIHDAEALNLFESDASRDIAYDSLLWHCSEGNRLQCPGCDVHLVYNCLGEMYKREIPTLDDGWYITYGYES